jgi:hypothetical protein
MRYLSGVRIFLAAIAVCAALALSLVAHHGANGAVATPQHLAPTPANGAPALRGEAP